MTDHPPFVPRRGAEAVDADGDHGAPDDTSAAPARGGRRTREESPDDLAGDVAVSAAPAVPHHHAAFMRPGTVPPPMPPTDSADPQVADAASPSQASLAEPGPAQPDGGVPATAVGSISHRPHLADEAVSSRPGITGSESARSRGHESPGSTPAHAEPAPGHHDELVAGRRHSRRRGMKVVAAVAAVAVAGGVFWGVRELTQSPTTSSTVTASASGSPALSSAKTSGALTSEMMITADEATRSLGAQGWRAAETLETIPATAPGITCMSNRQGLPNPVITRQRGLVSTSASQTALLQRIDAYADEASAKKAYAIDFAALAACNDVPAFLSSADAITQAADESFSVTVAFQDNPLQYHTVIIARTGVSVTMVDGANNASKLDTQKLLDATAPTLGRLATASRGTAPATPKAQVTAIPATPVLGWLAESDLPRLTAGQGRWNATEVAKVTSVGSGCENLTLATAAGPSKREQRSYLLSQDDAAPDQFGIDEVQYTFADPAGATAFATKLTGNIDGCAKRGGTATIKSSRTFTITGQDRAKVSGKVWLVEQKTGGNATVLFRVGVSSANDRVTYTLSKVAPSYDYPADSWLQLNARAGQRSTLTK